MSDCCDVDGMGFHDESCERARSLGLLQRGDRDLEAEEPPVEDFDDGGDVTHANVTTPPTRARTEHRQPRLFRMVRNADESGVSGTGHVLDGIEWHTGQVTVCWVTEHSSVTVYDDFATFRAIHIDPHPDNGTVIEWIEAKKPDPDKVAAAVVAALEAA